MTFIWQAWLTGRYSICVFAFTVRVAVLSGYSQSKWVSEQLVLEAGRRGTDVVISRSVDTWNHSPPPTLCLLHVVFPDKQNCCGSFFIKRRSSSLVTASASCSNFQHVILFCFLCLFAHRPSLVGPHELTGQCNHSDWLCYLIRGVVQLGLVPVGSGCDEKTIDVVSVDYVAAAIAFLSFSALGEQFAFGWCWLARRALFDNCKRFWWLQHWSVVLVVVSLQQKCTILICFHSNTRIMHKNCYHAEAQWLRGRTVSQASWIGSMLLSKIWQKINIHSIMGAISLYIFDNFSFGLKFKL